LLLSAIELINLRCFYYVDQAERLEPVGKEADLPQFWDGQAEVANLGSAQQLAVAVEEGGALISSAFMASGSNGS
jgi:hypothetical protein